MGLLEILPRLKSKTCDWTGGKKGFLKYCWQNLAEIKNWKISDIVIRETVFELREMKILI
jgi:hypothetical protein